MADAQSQPKRVLAVVPTMGVRLDTLPGSLASVAAQEGVATTLVVVVPKDATEARRIAEDNGALIVDDPARGLSAAVNAGIAAATTEEYFAWIGDDDVLLPGGLATLTAMLDARSDAVVAYGGCEYMNTQGQVFAVSNVGRLARHVLAWGPDLIPQPASLTRLADMVAVGLYDENQRFAMDLDMFLRLRKRGAFLNTRETVATYRWHPEALTVANRGQSVAEAERVKRAHLPAPLKPLAPLWEFPVRVAVNVVSGRLTRRARQLG